MARIPLRLALVGAGLLLMAACSSSRGGNSTPAGAEGEGEGEGGEPDAGLPTDSGASSDSGSGDDLGPHADLGGEEDSGLPPCSPDHPDGPCPQGEVCEEGRCVPAPCSPEQPFGRCPQGQVCVDGHCRSTECGPDNPSGECPDDEVCQDGACVGAELRLVSVEIAADRPANAADDAAPTPGEGNGLVDAGEEVALLPRVENRSGVPLLSVSGELHCPDELEVLDPIQSYDDLPIDTPDVPDAPFRVLVDPTLPHGALVTCTLSLADSREGDLTPLLVRLGVRRGIRLEGSDPFVDDDQLGQSDGDGDGRLDPGERIELVLDLANSGSVAIPLRPIEGDSVATALDQQRVVAALASPSPLIEVLELDNPPVYGDPMAPGDVARSAADFDLALSDEAAPGDRLCFELVLDLEAAGDTRLYHFVEHRCFEVGGGEVERCEPVTETCNGRDDDCDGLVADELPQNPCGGCGPTPEEVCNGEDDDCDGATDEGLAVDRGEDGAPGAGSCLDAPDCNDGDALVHPGADERCNGMDDDCDGSTDENLPLNACGTCGPVPEEACNGVDDDCDGATDEGLDVDQDGDEYPGGGSCGEATDCDDLSAAVHPGALEDCNGVDDDCDGDTDEGCDAACQGAESLSGEDQAVTVFVGGEDQTFEPPCSDGAVVGLGNPRDAVVRLPLLQRSRVAVTASATSIVALGVGAFLLGDDCLTAVPDACDVRGGAGVQASFAVTLDAGTYYLVVLDIDAMGVPLGSVDLDISVDPR